MWLERKDTNAPYEPTNCVWATPKSQNRNRRDNRLLTFRGETKLLVEWAEQYGLKRLTLHQRLYGYGWTLEKALTTPTGATHAGYRMLTLGEEVMTLTAWAKRLGLSPRTLQQRLRDGWTVEEALTRPATPGKRDMKQRCRQRQL